MGCNLSHEEKMEHMQHFFFKSFVISFVLLIFSTLMCIFFFDYQAQMMEKLFQLDVDDYSMLLVFLMGLWKVLIIQFTLIPALVIFCMRKCCCCKGKK